jgi:hypothetical protein
MSPEALIGDREDVGPSHPIHFSCNTFKNAQAAII